MRMAGGARTSIQHGTGLEMDAINYYSIKIRSLFMTETDLLAEMNTGDTLREKYLIFSMGLNYTA